MAERNPSKKRRQAQNEAARAAQAARSEAARGASPTKAEADPAAGSGRTGVFGRKRVTDAGPRPARTAAGVARATGTAARPARVASAKPTTGRGGSDAATDGTRGTGEDADTGDLPHPLPRPARPLSGPFAWLQRFGSEDPGGRKVLLSFVGAVASSVVLSFAKIFPPVDPKTKKILRVPDPKHPGKLMNAPTVTIWHVGGHLQAITYLAAVPVTVLLCILLARPPVRRRTWNYGFFGVLLFGFMLGAFEFVIVPLVFLGWGCWEARKAALASFDGDRDALRTWERTMVRGAARGRSAAKTGEPQDRSDEAPEDES